MSIVEDRDNLQFLATEAERYESFQSAMQLPVKDHINKIIVFFIILGRHLIS